VLFLQGTQLFGLGREGFSIVVLRCVQGADLCRPLVQANFFALLYTEVAGVRFSFRQYMLDF
jgi:hypothetical protein